MKKTYFVAIAIAVISILWVLSGVLTPEQNKETPQEHSTKKQKPKEAVEVRINSSLAESVVSEIIVTGLTRASREVDLKAETEGQVIEIVSEKGAAVTKDQVIARIEEKERKARFAEAKERLEQREIEYNAAKELQNKGFNSKVRLSQAGADLEAARAALKQSQVDLENTEIKAPFDGIIAGQEIEIGDYMGVGSMMFRIVDLDPVEIHGFLTERQVRQIKLNSKAMVYFIDGQVEKGTVSYIAPAADPQTRTFEVEISLANPESRIIDGLTARISIPGVPRRAHKISPSILSLNDQGEVGVKIVGENDQVVFVPVDIIEDKAGYMLVDGLPEKVRMITVGQDFVIPGQLVKPVEAGEGGLL